MQLTARDMAATAAVPHTKLGRVFTRPVTADRIGTLADFVPKDKGVQVRALPPLNGGSSTRVKNDLPASGLLWVASSFSWRPPLECEEHDTRHHRHTDNKAERCT